MTAPLSFHMLATQLSRRAARAFVSKLGPINPSLHRALATEFERGPGASGSFLAPLVFEAMFGYETVEEELQALAPDLLSEALVKALDEAEKGEKERPNRFPKDRHPYTHQRDAWRALTEEMPRSVLVTSGTGSGKTECFLVPILDSLVRQSTQKASLLTGVQALMLYPLNALINNQRDRLSAWTRGFGGKIRYCLYNGQTPMSAPASRTRERPEEVHDRRSLRANPPPVLLTNTTMLEYMLVRSEDQPILRASRGKLRWIVIDEAHTYLGSQAAELALLLRRVMVGFGVSPDELRFVATSATIGGGDAAQDLRLFLADLAGVDPSRVAVIEGRRHVPALPAKLAAGTDKLAPLEALGAATPPERFSMLARSTEARAIRSRMTDRRAIRLTELADLWPGRAVANDEERNSQALRLLDLMSSAKLDDETFLPLRGHIFHRTHGGVWACCNVGCPGRSGTALDVAAWPFGRLYYERRLTCDCGSKVFELLLCGHCGAEFIEAWETDAHVLMAEAQSVGPTVDEDDENEPDDDGAPHDVPSDEDKVPSAIVGDRRLVGQFRDQRTNAVSIDPMTGALAPGGSLGLSSVDPHDDNRLQCPACGNSEAPGRKLFWPLRGGAPFFLGVSVPALLELSPPMADTTLRPLKGRRTISFTDSRQGSARFAARVQAESERNFFRSWLYHQLWSNIKKPDDSKVARLTEDIAALEDALQKSPMARLKKMLADNKAELEKELAVGGGSLTWTQASKDFETNVESKWMAADWETRTGAKIGNHEIARYCLYREFLRRPRRYNSLETLGLVQIYYPALEQVSSVPAEWRSRGKSLTDWRAFLKLCLDFVLRGYGAIQVNDNGHGFTRWMGAPTPRLILSPDEPSQKNLPSWPQLRGARPGQMALALEAFLDLDRKTPDGAATINDLLREAWQVLQARQILRQQAGGVNLDLETQVEFRSVRDAWLCPITRRVLDTTLGGLTPFVPLDAPRASLKATPIKMPTLRFPHRRDLGSPVSVTDIDHWLETDAEVGEARAIGIWTEFSDRLATRTEYFRADEHSAQRAGYDLERMEERFKKGELNLLSCSTTMEMGVDIGGLSTIAMNNAPPGPANFLQRAGRAGRRGETRAVSLTLCKATPHGQAVFKNPMWPFETPVHVPRVSLESTRIVQRHVNSLALGTFLSASRQEALKLTSGPFFVGIGISPSDAFLAWLRDEKAWRPLLGEGLKQLVRRSALAGAPEAAIMETTAQMLEGAREGWRAEDDAVTNELDAVGGLPTKDDASPAQLALSRQRDRLRKEYLLRELAWRRFLPGYGFPIDVVPFINTNLDDIRADLKRQKRGTDPETDDDQRGHAREYPNRNRDMAIREYAPGADVVIGGKVFQSEGVTLSWHIPPGDVTIPEIQALRWAWSCSMCGTTGTSTQRAEACRACSDASKLRQKHYLVPAGFAVGISSKPDGDLSREQYVPVVAPWISVGGAEWSPLSVSTVGRHRYGPDGDIFVGSGGVSGYGYALCLRCGRAASETSDQPTEGDLPKELVDHRPLRGGKERDENKRCTGCEQPFAIKRGLWLGQSSQTDVYELQLSEPATGRPLSEAEAYSLAVALRHALAEKLGIDDRELGVAASRTLYPSGTGGYSIMLFDNATGGAGYVASAPPLVVELLERAQHILQCPRGCDSACHNCLLSFETQHQHALLDRKRALDLLDGGLIKALRLPKRLHVFGPTTRFELLPLATAIRREAARGGVVGLTLQLGGAAVSWDLDGWPLKRDLFRWLAQGLEVTLRIDDGLLSELSEADKQLLSSWVRNGVRVVSAQGVESREIATVGGATWTTRWAMMDGEVAAPGPCWGTRGEGDASAVNVAVSEPVTFEVPKGDVVTAADLVPPAEGWGDLAELSVRGQLEGAISSVGGRFWQLVADVVPELKRRFKEKVPLKEIRYDDRYIRSPLNARLLFEVLRELEKMGTSTETKVRVRTAWARRDNQRFPMYWTDDWATTESQTAALTGLFGVLKGKVGVEVLSTRETLHARELVLTWEDDASWELRLDQGLSFMEAVRRDDFPFSKSPEEQVIVMRTRNVALRKRDQAAVYLYCKDVGW